jgi:hypothetical protein
MNPDEFSWGKDQYKITTEKPILLAFTDQQEMLKFDSWNDFQRHQKCVDVHCVVFFNKHVFPSPGIDKAYYVADIQDYRGVIPETEQNCSWFGSSYESMTKAVEEARSKFAETHAFVNKVHTMIKDNQ